MWEVCPHVIIFSSVGLQVQKLQAILKPMMLRRLKEDVEKNLAPKQETIIEVELTNIQKKILNGLFWRKTSPFFPKGQVILTCRIYSTQWWSCGNAATTHISSMVRELLETPTFLCYLDYLNGVPQKQYMDWLIHPSLNRNFLLFKIHSHVNIFL